MSDIRDVLRFLHGLIAPSIIDNPSSGTIFFGSAEYIFPMPSHPLHAPIGLLNEKSLGSISPRLNPDTGHANLVENTNLSCVSFLDLLIFFSLVI